MNHVLYILSLVGFLILPFGVIWMRASRPKLMPWWAGFIVVAFFGWLLVNGIVYSYYRHLDDLMHSYGENPPEELAQRWAADGAKRVFALFFGWAYALIYYAPSIFIYEVIQLFKRLYPAPAA